VIMSGSYPDLANPFKRIASVFYLVAKDFDHLAFQMFALRGPTVSRERRCRVGFTWVQPRRRSGSSPRWPPEPLEDAMDDFWMPREGLSGSRVLIQVPEVETALLKRLGSLLFSGRPTVCHRVLTVAYAVVTIWGARAGVWGGGRRWASASIPLVSRQAKDHVLTVASIRGGSLCTSRADTQSSSCTAAA